MIGDIGFFVGGFRPEVHCGVEASFEVGHGLDLGTADQTGDGGGAIGKNHGSDGAILFAVGQFSFLLRLANAAIGAVILEFHIDAGIQKFVDGLGIGLLSVAEVILLGGQFGGEGREDDVGREFAEHANGVGGKFEAFCEGRFGRGILHGDGTLQRKKGKGQEECGWVSESHWPGINPPTTLPRVALLAPSFSFSPTLKPSSFLSWCQQLIIEYF